MEQEIEPFRELIWEYYGAHQRSFPWRETSDPYAVLVSEIMLQQTQTQRVLPKYQAWLEALPDFATLAAAPTAQVLELWQGLGYNRRGLALQRAARQVVDQHSGHLPESSQALRSLPGVGPYTAGAIQAFAFGQPVVFIETNIRRVFLHFFFPGQEGVRDGQLLPWLEASLDRQNVRHWHYALMDYGVHLAKTVGNPNRRSAHYSRQSAFEGSNRQLRGRLIRLLLAAGSLSRQELRQREGEAGERCAEQLAAEGFLVGDEGGFSLA